MQFRLNFLDEVLNGLPNELQKVTPDESRLFGLAAGEPAAMSHALLHPESVKGASKTVSFCTL
jgi:hypothetical protein